MLKWLWIAPMLAAAAWSQPRIDSLHVVPITPVGGFVVPAGTVLHARVDETLSTGRNQPGDRFTATLIDPVIANGQTVVPAGTRLTGHVLQNRQAGVFKGWAQLTLALDSFQLSGRSYPIELTGATCQAGHPHRDLKDPDPNAGVVMGNREQATIPAEAVVTFTLGSPVRV
jgi:hypothetical protein